MKKLLIFLIVIISLPLYSGCDKNKGYFSSDESLDVKYIDDSNSDSFIVHHNISSSSSDSENGQSTKNRDKFNQGKLTSLGDEIDRRQKTKRNQRFFSIFSLCAFCLGNKKVK